MPTTRSHRFSELDSHHITTTVPQAAHRRTRTARNIGSEDGETVRRPKISRVSNPPIHKGRNALPKRTLRASSRVTNLRALASLGVQSSDINTSNTITQGNSPFLRLPPEIRNTIYEMVLVSPIPLVINFRDPQQPGLTRTCKKVRLESLRIFYMLNNFTCIIQNYDPRNFKQYRKVADQYGLNTVVLTHRRVPDVTRAVLRKNLVEWLMVTFIGETAPLGYSAGNTEDTFKWEKLSHRIVKVFNLAKEMRKAKVSKETAMAVFENAVDAAGVCGEKLN